MEKPRKAWLAGLLSFFTIGLGQLYVGNPKKALFLYFFGQGLIGAIVLAVIIINPKPGVLFFGSLFFAVSFYIYNIIDAIKLAKISKEYRLKRYNRWYLYFFFWVLAVFFVQPTVAAAIKCNLVQAFKIPSGSMLPTIYVGDYILAETKLFIKGDINHGDIVIFNWPEDPSKVFIMRAIALGGDQIEIIDKRVYINEEFIQEPYVIHNDPRILKGSIGDRDNLGPIIIPDGSIFVLGDNRDESNDSRFWGYVRKENVIGRAISIYWSWDKSKKSVRWARLGNTIK
jgi:signal peptidase I